ncbi:MAG: hypothetical protein AAFN77_22825 [Planctomycetota bacterium]
MKQQDAARAVLIEVLNVLGAFKDDIVIVGGWVPDLTYPEKKHIGSLDVDLAIGPNAVGEDVYNSILNRLTDSNYVHHTAPTRFIKKVPNAPEPVKVDLISGEYVTGSGKSRSIMVDALKINSLRGVDLAFENSKEITIEGRMPNGSDNVVHARIVSPEAFLLIKAFALEERNKEKDAYDVAFVLRHYEPSIEALAESLKPIVQDGLGVDAMQILRDKFKTLDSVGPVNAALVAEENGADREQEQQAAFQNAAALFEASDQ